MSINSHRALTLLSIQSHKLNCVITSKCMKYKACKICKERLVEDKYHLLLNVQCDSHDDILTWGDVKWLECHAKENLGPLWKLEFLFLLQYFYLFWCNNLLKACIDCHCTFETPKGKWLQGNDYWSFTLELFAGTILCSAPIHKKQSSHLNSCFSWINEYHPINEYNTKDGVITHKKLTIPSI